MAPSAPAPAVVQKFKPTGGAIIGWSSLVVLGAGVVLAVVSERSLFGLRVVLVLLLLMLLAWTALLRPRAEATAATLRLRNMFSEHHVPLTLIDGVAVRQMLVVWTEERRYHCVGIGRSARQLMGNKRKRGPMAVLGIEQTDDRMGLGQQPVIDESVDYAAFVENRIEDLVRSAKRDRLGEGQEVRRVWARPEIIGVVVLSVALVVSLVVG